MTPLFDDVGYGIYCIDVDYFRKRLACCYLMVEGDAAAIIETGTSLSRDNVLATMAAVGVTPEQVQYVIPTHVHLDHAGGAGALMAVLPNAKLVVHPRGARHLINPEKLIAGTIAVYGEQRFAQLYGEILPIDEHRVVESSDQMELFLNGRRLELRDTPGHAAHHHCVWDERSKGWFSGDTFGLSYEDMLVNRRRFGMITTTPVQFDPAAMSASVQMMLSYRPERVYLTHYNVIENPQEIGQQLLRQIQPVCDIALAAKDNESRQQTIKQNLLNFFIGEMRKLDTDIDQRAMHESIAMDVELDAQGLDVWLQRQIQ